MAKAPYGSWSSPITSELITRSTIRLSGLKIDGDDAYWLELRPKEGGRTVIVRQDKLGKISDVTPAPFNVRTLAHEYGGGAYTVEAGIVYFCNYADQRIYSQQLGGTPEPLTEAGKIYYADLTVDRQRNRIVCVQEDHSAPEQEALTTLASISLASSAIEMIVAGNDFYSNPRLSPNGLFMSWISWNHPNMPWDQSSLYVANVGSDATPTNIRRIAGGADESVFEPQWSPAGALFYVSDRSGFWNIYRHNDYEEPQAVCPLKAEFGLPAWNFDMSTYGFASETTLIAAYGQNGTWKLTEIDLATGKMNDFPLPYSELNSVRATESTAYFIGGSFSEPASIVQLDLKAGTSKVLRKASEAAVDAGYISRPETVEFPTSNGKTAFAFFYPPKNSQFQGEDGELPPLIVHSHGGPTSSASSTLSLSIQYWTSRGFALVDVNYGGSSGFGREYRNRLSGAWGIVDVDDCINAAKYLAELKKVDPDRMAISGGSAGGYTTLCALTFHNVFKAGASHYGVSDLEALEVDTHKFESRYSHRLVGPYPEAKSTYKERSPINYAQQLKCPVIFFQGLEDKIVPPNQSETMVNALKKGGVKVAYVTFKGEQHGFRQAENIRRALDGELYFYAQIFNFALAEEIEPVPIYNHPGDSRAKRK